MRAWFGALADKSLPSLIAVAAGEVAAAFKGILKSLSGMWLGSTKTGRTVITKVLSESVVWRRFGRRRRHLASGLIRRPGGAATFFGRMANAGASSNLSIG
jgi:hypothetical protein